MLPKKIIIALFIVLPCMMHGQAEEELYEILGKPAEVDISEMPLHFRVRVNNLSQFFGRFNLTQNIYGEKVNHAVQDWEERYSVGAKREALKSIKKGMLHALADSAWVSANTDLFQAFINAVQQSEAQLDYESTAWYSLNYCFFEYRKERIPVQLLMETERFGNGWRWAIADVFAPDIFPKQDKGQGYIQPMAHENGFMDLRKAFSKEAALQAYFTSELTYSSKHIFIHLFNQGALKYLNVDRSEFYFFSIPGWVFRVTYFNRASNASGWLIDFAAPLGECTQEEYMSLIMN